MKTKKIPLAFILVGVLLMCLLCSCGQKTVQSNGVVESKTDSTDSSTKMTTSEVSTTGTTTQNSSKTTTQKSVDTQGEAMLGTWYDSVSKRAMMTVKRTSSGFSVVIHWSSSAMDSNEWRMTGTFEDSEDGRIVSDNCAMYEVSTDENGNTTEKNIYTGGKAHITYVNGMLYWFDAKEDAGAECMFVKE